MRFAWLWGLALAAAIACGRGDAPGPAPSSTEPAGKVLSVEGRATARRAAEGSPERELAVDAPVWGDDTVAAAAGATLRVLLAHNGVTWTLEGGSAGVARRVDASVAWKAAKGSGEAEALAKAEKDRTASAGRHTEAEAAGTAASAEGAPAAAAAPAKPEEAPKAEEATAAKPEAQPVTRAPEKPAQAPPPPRRAKPKKMIEGNPEDPLVGLPEDVLTPKASPPPPPPPPAPAAAAPAPAPARAPEPAPADAKKDSGGGGAGASTVTLTVTEVGPGLDRSVAQREIRKYLGRFRSCVEQATAANPSLRGAVTVRFAVDTRGAPHEVVVATQPENGELGACVKGAVAGGSYAAAAQTTTIVFRLEFGAP